MAFTGQFGVGFFGWDHGRQMLAYPRGLLRKLEQKKGWSLAEAVGDTGPQGMQRCARLHRRGRGTLRDP
jgi:hypothetical protein